MKPSVSLAVMLSVMLGVSAHGMFEIPESVPVERLLELAERAAVKSPSNAEAHYAVARTHYLAFVSGAKRLDAYLPYKNSGSLDVESLRSLTGVTDWAIDKEAERRVLEEMKIKSTPWSPASLFKRYMARWKEIAKELRASEWQFNTLPEAESAAHIREAVVHFQTAMTLAPKRSMIVLGYASFLEQAALWKRHHPKAVVPETVRKADASAVLDEYRRAWAMELADDLKNKKSRGAFSPMDMVSYEAGYAFVRLTGETKDISNKEKKTLSAVRHSLITLKRETGGAMTPIIFTTHPVISLTDLLAVEHVVDFPLRGWGPDGHWPWVKADTAILVWNPSRSGHITGGAQLFGSYTWELFWKTGYEPLAVLDADDNGELRGAELDGLAAWFDRNGNGVSDPGEVQPLSDLGVAALAAHAANAEGRHPMNAAGITFTDGRVLPTWDWIVEPVASPGKILDGRKFSEARLPK